MTAVHPPHSPGRDASDHNAPDTSVLRRRYTRARLGFISSLSLFVASLILGNFAAMFGLELVIGLTIVTMIPLAAISGIATRQFGRALRLQERRDEAARQRSSDWRPVPVTPALYLPDTLHSPEMARLRALSRREARGLGPAGILFVMAYGAMAISSGPGRPAATFVFAVSGLAFAALLVRAYVIGGATRAALDQQLAREGDYRASVIAASTPTPTAPVIYLRSFSDDARAGRRYGELTEEEHLAKALAWIGPLVAVGRPGEPLPQVGAQRLYLTDDVWQARVAELMSQARLVVLRTGSSTGFDWELSHALSTLAPERLLVVADSRSELRRLLETVARRTGRGPVRRALLPGPSIASVKGLVIFGAGWSASFLRLRRGFLRVTEESGPLVGRFTLSLRPLFDRLGVSYRVPPFSRVKIFWLVSLIGTLLLLVVGDWDTFLTTWRTRLLFLRDLVVISPLSQSLWGGVWDETSLSG